jgi:hypothetical protein
VTEKSVDGAEEAVAVAVVQPGCSQESQIGNTVGPSGGDALTNGGRSIGS